MEVTCQPWRGREVWWEALFRGLPDMGRVCAEGKSILMGNVCRRLLSHRSALGKFVIWDTATSYLTRISGRAKGLPRASPGHAMCSLEKADERAPGTTAHSWDWNTCVLRDISLCILTSWAGSYKLTWWSQVDVGLTPSSVIHSIVLRLRLALYLLWASVSSSRKPMAKML